MSDSRIFPERWPLSNNFILLAILLLVATAFALVTSTEAVANEIATYAYYALVVGVVIRVLELAIGERVARALVPVRDRLVAWVRGLTLPSPARPSKPAAPGIARPDLALDLPGAPGWAERIRFLRDVLAYTLAALTVSVVLVALYYRDQPYTFIPARFYLLLAGVYGVLLVSLIIVHLVGFRGSRRSGPSP